jgi:hypothetical protein
VKLGKTLYTLTVRMAFGPVKRKQDGNSEACREGEPSENCLAREPLTAMEEGGLHRCDSDL